MKTEKILEATDWDTALNLVINELKVRGMENSMALSGKLSDIETLYSAKTFLNSIGSNLYDSRFDNVQFIPDNRSSYLFNSSIQ